MKALVLWLLTSAALTAGSPMPAGGAKPTGHVYFESGRPSVILSSSGAAFPVGTASPFSRDDVHDAAAEVPAQSSESSAEDDDDDDDDELPENEEIDARSIFAALFDDGEDDSDEGGSYEAYVHRDARFVGDHASSSDSTTSESPMPSEVRAVSDRSTIAKYNHFIDVFFRRVNSELGADGDPMEISLSPKNRKTRKGEKGRKKKKGKGKKGNKSKKDRRNPRGYNHEGVNGTDDRILEEESPESAEDSEDEQRFTYSASDTADDDPEELEDDSTEVSEGSSRQSKDLEFKDEKATDQSVAGERGGRGFGMERRRAESKRLKQNRGNAPKNVKQRKNRNKKGKKGKRRRRKGGKNRPGGQRRRNKKENRGRSRDSTEESDVRLSQRSQPAHLDMAGRKRKDEAEKKGGKGGNSDKDRKRKKNKKSKQNKRGSNKNKADTVASVSGFSSLSRQDDVNVTQSSSTQRISSHFALGPVTVLLTRRFSDGLEKTAVSTAVLRGVVVIEVNKSGRAKVARLKINKPSSVVTEGSLRADDSNKKKGNKSEKVVKTSIRKVSPQISKQIEATARSVLDATSRAVRS